MLYLELFHHGDVIVLVKVGRIGHVKVSLAKVSRAHKLADEVANLVTLLRRENHICVLYHTVVESCDHLRSSHSLERAPLLTLLDVVIELVNIDRCQCVRQQFLVNKRVLTQFFDRHSIILVHL